MGAFGAALYAEDQCNKESLSLFKGEETLDSLKGIVTDQLHCKGCNNRCQVMQFKFANGNISFAGNKCERIFHSNSKAEQSGYNGIEEKYDITFASDPKNINPKGKVIGIPRVLNMYENFILETCFSCLCFSVFFC